MNDPEIRDLEAHVEAKCAEFGDLASERERRALVSQLLPGEKVLVVLKGNVPLDSEHPQGVRGEGIAVATGRRVIFLSLGDLGEPRECTLSVSSIRSASSSIEQTLGMIEIHLTTTGIVRADSLQPVEAVPNFADAVNESRRTRLRELFAPSGHGDRSDDNSARFGGPAQSESSAPRVAEPNDLGRFGIDRDRPESAYLIDLLDGGEQILHAVTGDFSLGIRLDGRLRTTSHAYALIVATSRRLLFLRTGSFGETDATELQIDDLECASYEAGDRGGEIKVTGNNIAFCTIRSVTPSSGAVNFAFALQSALAGDPGKEKQTNYSIPATPSQRPERPDARSGDSPPRVNGGTAPPPTRSEEMASSAGSGWRRFAIYGVIVVAALIALIGVCSLFGDGRLYEDGWQECRPDDRRQSNGAFFMTADKELTPFPDGTYWDPCGRSDQPLPTPEPTWHPRAFEGDGSGAMEDARRYGLDAIARSNGISESRVVESMRAELRFVLDTLSRGFERNDVIGLCVNDQVRTGRPDVLKLGLANYCSDIADFFD